MTLEITQINTTESTADNLNYRFSNDAAYQFVSEYTESLLPYRKIDRTSTVHPTAQANANRQCQALAEFWATEEGKDWKEVIEQKVKSEINTPELLAWQEDFDRRYPPLLC